MYVIYYLTIVRNYNVTAKDHHLLQKKIYIIPNFMELFEANSWLLNLFILLLTVQWHLIRYFNLYHYFYLLFIFLLI